VKETNPKAAIGAHKIPFHLWPESASALGSLGMLDGMLKYGRANWRVSGVRAYHLHRRRTPAPELLLRGREHRPR
jgi:hypothetical protein